jgi:deoxycytidylate deaminase
VAKTLETLLREANFSGEKFDVETIKAREVIAEWALAHGEQLPDTHGPSKLPSVISFQNLGDKMRSALSRDGKPDHAAVARALIGKIRERRAALQNVTIEEDKPVVPDGHPRAYILDSVRHPEEVELLRRIYEDAFVLIGVVCEEERRRERLLKKYADAGRDAISKFMGRDASADEKAGQHVADAFHLSDFFVDNTANRTIDNRPNLDWDINDHLSRLIRILLRNEVVPPWISETAMHHAFSAAMRSTCLSRQVGAALVDRTGVIIATGTNEVPKAGGGVYGEGFAKDPLEGRCALMTMPEGKDRFCRNTQTQNEIIDELITDIPELQALSDERKGKLKIELRHTQIGSLIEFSRAVHAEMDAVLSAARKSTSIVGTRLFVTTFPCHYCARHIVTAGLDEVQYIEPYPKSRALMLHDDAIKIERTGWKPISDGGTHVLFRPFSGIAPRLYKKAFLKDREFKDKNTGTMEVGLPIWGQPWHLGRISYVDLEAELTKQGGTEWKKQPVGSSK